MRLSCTECSAPVKAADINLDRMLAKCTACDAVFSFGGGLAPAAVNRGEVGRPRAIGVARDGKGLELTRSWFNLGLIPLAFFCIAWDSFLVFWYTIAFSTATPWIMKVFPIGHVAVGVGLTYACMAGFLNRTVVAVERDSLRISHGPLPWRGGRTIRVADLEQLFTKEVLSNQRHGGVSRRYTLGALLRGGERLDLLTGLESEEALFLEQQVEQHLGIEDRAVAGELARTSS